MRQEAARQIEWHAVVALVALGLRLVLQQPVVDRVAMHAQVAVQQRHPLLVKEILPRLIVRHAAHLQPTVFTIELYTTVLRRFADARPLIQPPLAYPACLCGEDLLAQGLNLRLRLGGIMGTGRVILGFAQIMDLLPLHQTIENVLNV